MPGFNIGGQNSNMPSATTELRRKHRWVFILTSSDIADLRQAVLFLQKAARPSIKFEEAVMYHDQEKSYYAGQTTWDPIELTWYDAEQQPNCSKAIWDWIYKVSNIEGTTVKPPSEYKKIANINMYTGSGRINEKWTLYNAWPISSNWQELDYTSTDIQTIVTSVRFDRAVKEK